MKISNVDKLSSDYKILIRWTLIKNEMTIFQWSRDNVD